MLIISDSKLQSEDIGSLLTKYWSFRVLLWCFSVFLRCASPASSSQLKDWGSRSGVSRLATGAQEATGGAVKVECSSSFHKIGSHSCHSCLSCSLDNLDKKKSRDCNRHLKVCQFIDSTRVPLPTQGNTSRFCGTWLKFHIQMLDGRSDWLSRYYTQYIV